MAATVAQLAVDVTANTDKAQRGLAAVNDTVGKAPALFKAATIGVAAFTAASAAVFALVGGALIYAIKQASDADVVIQQTNAVLASTHGIAGMTAQSIADLANNLETLTGIDDDDVRAAEDVLLTYTNIGAKGGIFDQTTQTVLDMATSINRGAIPTQQQLADMAKVVGRAINDPINGTALLTRYGVTLTATQKEQIKQFMAVNDVMDAQKVVLGALETKYGGAAEAAGNTLPGMLDKLKNSLNDVFKAVGQVVLPLLLGFMSLVVKLVQPLGDDLSGALGDVKKRFDDLQKALAPLQGPWQALQHAAQELWQILKQNLQPAIGDIVKAFGGGDGFSQGVKDAATKLTDFINSGVKQAAPIVDGLAKGLASLVKDGFQKVKDFLNSDFAKNLKDMSGTMKNDLGGAITGLAYWFQHDLVPALNDAKPGFEKFMGVLGDLAPKVADLMGHLDDLKIWFAQHIGSALGQAIPPLIKLGGEVLGKIADGIKTIGPHIQDFIKFLGQAKTNADSWKPALDAIGRFIANTVAPALGKLKDRFLELLPKIKEFGQWVNEHVVPVVKDLAKKFQDAAPHIRQLAQDISERLAPIIKNAGTFINTILLPALGAIGDFIKTQVEPKLKDLKAFWDAIWPGLQQTIQTVWGIIQGIITIAWNIISGIIKVGLDILGGNWKQAWADMKQSLGGVWQGIQQIAQSAFGKLHDVVVQKATDLKNGVISALQALPGKLGDLGTQMINALANAIRNGAGKIADAFHAVIHNAASHLPGGITIPGFAGGTNYAPGGLALVGERGPEVLYVPRGSQVLPAQQTAALLSSGGNSVAVRGNSPTPVVINIIGSDYSYMDTLAKEIHKRIRRQQMLTDRGLGMWG